MVKDLNNVIRRMKSYGTESPRSIEIVRDIIEGIYNTEMSYLNIIWDDSKCWWDIDTNARFTDDFKLRFENCLKEKHLQTTDDWLSRIHILNFKEIIMTL